MKKILLISVGSILAIIIIISIWATFFRSAGSDVVLTVKSGQSKSQIAQNLKNKNLILSPLFFTLYTYKNHDVLQSGVYKITSDMSMPQIIAMMREGKFDEYAVTIPEGWRLTQIDELLTSKKIIKKGDLIKVAASSEGKLFPDTYYFEPNVTAEQIRDQMIADFNERTTGLRVDSKTLIIASIVEREAKFDVDRAKIAGVYLSRLDTNMKLQSNPTVEYAKGEWGPITASDIQNLNSPYNTYLYAGLPPGPICNPGLKSIEAALNPTKDGNLFFFTDSSGHAVFSKTYDEHQAKLKQS